ncbi:MAG: hypothetical protein JW801_08690 [Bacteroidales bacterium]|nr:hypothetical protein [Bacteroidales bacterium]
MKKLCLLALLALPAFNCFGQLDTLHPRAAMNVIHVDFGIIGLNANYERTFREFNRSHLNYRAGFGWVVDFIAESNANLIGSVQYIYGVRWIHFEAGLGLNFMVRKAWDSIAEEDYLKPQLMPLVMIGLRIEPPGKGPVFRLGLGTESSVISAGLGWKF